MHDRRILRGKQVWPHKPARQSAKETRRLVAKGDDSFDYATKPLRPVIDRVFPIEAAAEAFRYEQEGRHFGKIGLAV